MRVGGEAGSEDEPPGLGSACAILALYVCCASSSVGNYCNREN